MQPARPGPSNLVRLVAVLFALLVLLWVVAFASRTRIGGSSHTGPTPGYINWAVSIFLVLFVLMIPVAVYAYALQMRLWREQNAERRTMQSRIVRTLGIFAFILLIFGARSYLHRHNALPVIHAPWLHTGKGRGADATAVKPYHPTFQWPVVWIALVLLLGTVAAVWWTSKQRPPLDELDAADPTIEEDVAVSIDGALDDLEREADPRRAVIAAYARMEAVLARRGLERRASETPIEYLRRVLLELTSRTAAVETLTRLFQEAKFSRHTVDAAMKTEAIDALRTIRDDLRPA